MLNVNEIKTDIENIFDYVTALNNSIENLQTETFNEIKIKELLKETSNSILSDLIVFNDFVEEIQNCYHDQQLTNFI